MKFDGWEMTAAIVITAIICIGAMGILLHRQETNWGMGTINGIRHTNHGTLVHISVYDGFEKEFRWKAGGDAMQLYPGDRIEFRWLPSKYDADVTDDDPYGWRPRIVKYEFLSRGGGEEPSYNAEENVIVWIRRD